MNQQDLEQEIIDAEEALDVAVDEVDNANASLRSAHAKLLQVKSDLEQFYNDRKAEADQPY